MSRRLPCDAQHRRQSCVDHRAFPRSTEAHCFRKSCSSRRPRVLLQARAKFDAVLSMAPAGIFKDRGGDSVPAKLDNPLGRAFLSLIGYYSEKSTMLVGESSWLLPALVLWHDLRLSVRGRCYVQGRCDASGKVQLCSSQELIFIVP